MEVQPQPLTTRPATQLVLKRPGQRTNADTQFIAQLQAQHYELAAAIELAQDFCAMVRERHPDRFDHWLACAVAGGVAPLRRFAAGLRADYDAVKAGMMLPWSNGPVVGACSGFLGNFGRLVVRVLDMIISVTYDGTRIGGRL